MNNQQYTPIDQPKKSNTGMIIAIVVVVLLCCCCLLLAGGYYMKTRVDNTFSSINQQFGPSGGSAVSTAEAMATAIAKGTNPVDMPTEAAGATETPSSDIPTVEVPSSVDNMIPQGGLGNDIVRATAWGYVVAASTSNGCNSTDATKVTIAVTKKPASPTSTWAEKWTVTCMDGSNASFDVTFTPDSTGATVSVTPSK